MSLLSFILTNVFNDTLMKKLSFFYNFRTNAPNGGNVIEIECG